MRGVGRDNKDRGLGIGPEDRDDTAIIKAVGTPFALNGDRRFLSTGNDNVDFVFLFIAPVVESTDLKPGLEFV